MALPVKATFTPNGGSAINFEAARYRAAGVEQLAARVSILEVQGVDGGDVKLLSKAPRTFPVDALWAVTSKSTITSRRVALEAARGTAGTWSSPQESGAQVVLADFTIGPIQATTGMLSYFAEVSLQLVRVG